MDHGADLYRRYLQGDDSGLAELIREYMDGLTLYLNGIVRDLSAAEDLTEDTFVKLATKKPRFSEKSSFKTWLYAIGRNIALDHLKKETRRGCYAAITTPQQLQDEEDLEAAYLREDRNLTIRRTLRQLKPEYRQILWLIYFEGFSSREAAMVMRKNIHSVETLAYRARLALKSKLYEEGFVYEEL